MAYGIAAFSNHITAKLSKAELEARKLKALKEMAKLRGELYLSYGEAAFKRNDLLNANSYVDEGLLLSVGPFYLAVRDKLHDLKKRIQNAMLASTVLLG